MLAHALDHPDAPPGHAVARVLALAFAAAVAVWFAGYATHIIGGDWAGPATAAAIGAVLVVTGVVAGRTAGASSLTGAWVGLATGGINLMILGSVLGGDGAGRSALLLSPLATALVVGLVAAVARLTRSAGPPDRATPDWTARFALVALAATAVLLLSGGLVTAREAGLAVKDWPTSFGHNMWLYPLAKMTGNIYYEHTHRLYGTLVGLATVALAVQLLPFDRRAWVKALAVVAVAAVVAQGVMGGLRVTEAVTPDVGVEVARPEHETAASAFLRVAHGTFAQVFFALMAGLAVVVSPAWKRTAEPTPHPAASTDRVASLALVALLLLQLVLGARVRHLHDPVVYHLLNAVIVSMAALIVGMRCWGMHGPGHPALLRVGVALVAVVTLQLCLGFAAFFAKGIAAHATDPTRGDVVFTTAHQFTGALLLAVAVAAALLVHRTLTPSVATHAAPLQARG